MPVASLLLTAKLSSALSRTSNRMPNLYPPSLSCHGRFHSPANHRIGFEGRMQKDAYEMGQVVLELLHVWSLTGLWVSQPGWLHLHFTRCIAFGAPWSFNGCINALLTIATAAQSCWPQKQHLGIKRMHQVLFAPSQPCSSR